MHPLIFIGPHHTYVASAKFGSISSAFRHPVQINIVLNWFEDVPVIFLGPGINPGPYPQHVAVNDIAPTLAAILEIEPPSGSTGGTLSEILN